MRFDILNHLQGGPKNWHNFCTFYAIFWASLYRCGSRVCQTDRQTDRQTEPSMAIAWSNDSR